MDIDPKLPAPEKGKFWKKPKAFDEAVLSPIGKFGAYVIFGVQIIAMAYIAGFWWLENGMPKIGGTICLIILWCFVFNEVHEKGLKCLQDKMNTYFLLPLSILSSIGYIIGSIYRWKF